MLGLSIVFAAAAPVAPVADDIATLRDLVKAEKWQEAAAIARSVEARVAERAPLEVTEGNALAAPPQGLGMFVPAHGGLIRGGELFLYAEVRNHVLRQTAAGFELHLVSDLVLLNRAGEEVARDPAFAASRFTATTPHRVTFVVVALRTRGLPSGHFTARLLIHDQVGNKSGTVDIPFKVP
jgi:hypothetical protein